MNNVSKPTVSQKQPLNTTMLIMQCIGIIAVVLGHADIGGPNIPNPLTVAFPYYSWHMPFFIFISGYFFNREMKIGPYLWKKTRNHLLPALAVNAVCGLFSMGIQHWDLTNYGQDITLKSLLITPFTTGYQFYINVSLWFIFALFLIEIVACVMDRLARGKGDMIYLVLSLMVSLYCCVRVFYDHDGTRGEYRNALLRFGFLTFFFWLGVCYRRYFEGAVKKIWNAKWSAVLFILQALLLSITGYNITYNTRDMDFSTLTVPHGFGVAIVAPIIAIAFFLGIAYTLTPYLAGNQTLRLLGQNAKYVVYYHQLCFVLFSLGLAALIEQNILPSIAGFSVEQMRKTAYYTGGNVGISLLVSIASFWLPIGFGSWIKKRRWYVAVSVYSGIAALILLFLYLASKAIY